MTEEDQEKEEHNKDKEELEKLGVGSTFNLLSQSDKKKKEEKKPEFRGFK